MYTVISITCGKQMSPNVTLRSGLTTTLTVIMCYNSALGVSIHLAVRLNDLTNFFLRKIFLPPMKYGFHIQAFRGIYANAVINVLTM